MIFFELFARELFWEGKSVYVFLQNQQLAKDAFAAMNVGSWIGRTVALYNPVYKGEYKSTPVVELQVAPLIPIEVNFEVGDDGVPKSRFTEQAFSEQTVDDINQLRSCRYNNVEKFEVDNIMLLTGCAASACDSAHGSDEECISYGCIPDAPCWVMEGRLWLDENTPPFFIRSRKFAELFLKKSMIQRASTKIKVDHMEVETAVNNMLDEVFKTGVTWTLCGFYKPGVRGRGE